MWTYHEKGWRWLGEKKFVVLEDSDKEDGPGKQKEDLNKDILRSSSFHQLFIPRHNLSFGSRAFCFSAPRIWNSLPLRIREIQSLPAFKRHLKTHFSSQLTPPHSNPPSNAPWFFNRLRRYINFVLTYLLTYLHEYYYYRVLRAIWVIST